MKKQEHSSLPKSITERTMFFKMRNFPVFGFLRISTSENEKKCRRKFTKNHHFLACSPINRMVQIAFLSQNMIKMYAPSILRDNLSTKSIPASLLSS